MRRLSGAMFALAVGATTLAGCSQGSGAMGPIDVDPAAVEAHVAKLASDTLKGTKTTPANLELVRGLLPPDVQLSWGNLTFDAATNSTLVTNVKLTPKDMPTVGLQISELRLWDFDAEFLKARLSGQRLSETAPLARRIDAKGVSVFGFADAINQGMGGARLAPSQGNLDDLLQTVPADPTKFEQPGDELPPQGVVPEGAPEGWPATTEPEFQYELEQISRPHFDKFDISLGRMIIDDLVLKPYQLVTAPKPAADADYFDPMSTFLPMLQTLASFTQSYGIDTAAYYDFKADIAMTENGQKIGGNFLVKTLGARGLRGGDMDAMFMRDLSYDFAMPNPEGGAPIDMSMTLASSTVDNLKLAKALGYLVKGVMPPRTETDLMGLGVWRSENEVIKIGGKPVYTIGETLFDGTGFHWFIPTKLQASAKKVTIDIGNFLDFAQQMAPPYDPTDEYSVDARAEMQQARAMFEKHGLTKPTLDFDFGWNWNAGNGDARLDLGVGGPDLLDFSARYEGAFPSYNAVWDTIPEKGPMNPMALSAVFMDKTALKLIDINVKDNGGLTKVFGIMGDFAPAMGMAPEPMTGDQVRAMVVDGLKMASDPATTGMPALAGLMAPVLQFVSTGGKLHIAMQPSEPMSAISLFTTLQSAQGSPEMAIKKLGLKVEHTK